MDGRHRLSKDGQKDKRRNRRTDRQADRRIEEPKGGQTVGEGTNGHKDRRI